ncbi:lipoprotein [Campylobacter gastrosuis]
MKNIFVLILVALILAGCSAFLSVGNNNNTYTLTKDLK